MKDKIKFYDCPRCGKNGMCRTFACWLECVYCGHYASEIEVQGASDDESEVETGEHADE